MGSKSHKKIQHLKRRKVKHKTPSVTHCKNY